MSDLVSFGAPSTASFGESQSAKSDNSHERVPAAPAVTGAGGAKAIKDKEEAPEDGIAKVEFVQRRGSTGNRSRSASAPYTLVGESVRARNEDQNLSSSSSNKTGTIPLVDGRVGEHDQGQEPLAERAPVQPRVGLNIPTMGAGNAGGARAPEACVASDARTDARAPPEGGAGRCPGDLSVASDGQPGPDLHPKESPREPGTASGARPEGKERKGMDLADGAEVGTASGAHDAPGAGSARADGVGSGPGDGDKQAAGSGHGVASDAVAPASPGVILGGAVAAWASGGLPAPQNMDVDRRRASSRRALPKQYGPTPRAASTKRLVDSNAAPSTPKTPKPSPPDAAAFATFDVNLNAFQLKKEA